MGWSTSYLSLNAELLIQTISLNMLMQCINGIVASIFAIRLILVPCFKVLGYVNGSRTELSLVKFINV